MVTLQSYSPSELLCKFYIRLTADIFFNLFCFLINLFEYYV